MMIRSEKKMGIKKRSVLAAGLMALAMLAPGRAPQGAEPVGQAPKQVIGEIKCEGQVSYRTGVAPWLNKTEGTFPVVMPVAVRTAPDARRCQVTLESLGTFYFGNATEAEITQVEGGPVTIGIKDGAAGYCIPESTELKLVATSFSIVAVAGPAVPRTPELAVLQAPPINESTFVPAAVGINSRDLLKGAKPDAAFDAKHMGIIEVTPEYVDLHNFRGNLAYQKEDGAYQLLAPNESIRITIGVDRKRRVAYIPFEITTPWIVVGAAAAAAVIGGVAYGVSGGGGGGGGGGGDNDGGGRTDLSPTRPVESYKPAAKRTEKRLLR